MFFSLSGLKQSADKQHKLSLIIEHSSKDALIDFLKGQNILILSLREHTDTPITFGETIFGYRDGDTVYKGYIELDAKDAFRFLAQELGLELYYINFRSRPIPLDRVPQILNKLKKDLKAQEDLDNDIIVEHKVSRNEQKIEQFRESVLENIKEAKSLIDQTKEEVSPALIKELDTTVSHLLRLRMGKNVEKMVILFEDMLRLMEKIEFAYFAKQKEHEEESRGDEYVGYLDIVKEYEQLKKAKKKKQLKMGMIDDAESVYYSSLGNIGIHIKLLLKEAGLRLRQSSHIMSKLLDSAELFCLFYIVLITRLVLLIYRTDSMTAYYHHLLTTAIGGIIIMIARSFGATHSRHLIIIWIGSIVSFIGLNRLATYLLAL